MASLHSSSVMPGGVCVVLVIAMTLASGLAPAQAVPLKLPACFSDNMVLQRDGKAPVWGLAEPGEEVTVTLGAIRRTTFADRDGKWQVVFRGLEAGGPHEMVVAGRTATIRFKNVMVGDVWVCSGQSNMEMTVQNSMNAEEEIANAKYPNIRLLKVAKVVAASPQSDTQGSWVECSPQTIPGFSAVGYFFGRELHKTLGVPIGLINSSWGGTPAEAWTSEEALKFEPDFKPILDRFQQALARYPQAMEEYQKKVAQWEEEVKKAKAEGKPVPRRPGPPPGPDSPNRPSGLYNGMIAPLVPYGIAGAIWYQGEANAGRAYQYRKLLPAMIQDWRRNWNQGDFPFLIVQLANFMARDAQPAESAWAELREAQTMTAQTLPNTGLACIIDIGEEKDIHPKNKQDVGKRLALAALKIAHGQDIVYSGPMYDSMVVEGNKIRLRFKHVGGGLMVKGGPELKGFAIAGEDKKFVWAKAQIEGESVIVWADEVKQPVAVRYAWGNNPECNLYNKEGLPAVPFRTDDWPGTTINAR